MSSRGFTAVTASISHGNLCCPNAQHQFETFKGIGLLVWCVTNRPSNLLTKSYSWRLGEVCRDAHCTVKTVSRQLKRRTSLCYETDDENFGRRLVRTYSYHKQTMNLYKYWTFTFTADVYMDFVTSILVSNMG